jgi:hypothetical protein
MLALESVLARLYLVRRAEVKHLKAAVFSITIIMVAGIENQQKMLMSLLAVSF